MSESDDEDESNASGGEYAYPTESGLGGMGDALGFCKSTAVDNPCGRCVGEQDCGPVEEGVYMCTSSRPGQQEPPPSTPPLLPSLPALAPSLPPSPLIPLPKPHV